MIRNWTPEDFGQVFRLLQVTWEDTYAGFIPNQDLKVYLDKTYNIVELQALYNSTEHTCFVSEVQQVISGWLKLWNDSKNGRFYISSLYVLPSSQGTGLGKEFLKIASESALSLGYNKVYLGVMEQNTKALSWYTKNGFVFEERLPFTMISTEVPHLIGYKIIV